MLLMSTDGKVGQRRPAGPESGTAAEPEALALPPDLDASVNSNDDSGLEREWR